MQCLVLAGGLATRMRPATLNLPKSLLPIQGIPFVDYQLQWLSMSGIDEVIFSVGYLGNMLKDYVGDGRKWNLKVRYVDEGDSRLGTGGALALCLQEGNLDSKFFLLYGDSFLPISFSDVWSASQVDLGSLLMTVYLNQNQYDRSNVCFRDGRVVLYDKSASLAAPGPLEYIDYGLSVFTRDLISDTLSQKSAEFGRVFDLAPILTYLSEKGFVAGYVVTERFYEIGSTEGMEDFSRWVQENRSFFK